MREIKFRAWDSMEKKMRSPIAVTSDGVAYAEWGKDKPSWILMQYTGLKDKNGKEVYEGDKLELGIVGWSEADGAWIVGDYLMGHKNTNCEVIGNIYENPELVND